MATANASGDKQGSTLAYDPFGQALTAIPDNSAGSLDYGWLGEKFRALEHAPRVATIEMGARQYVPGIGRFLEVDPVEGGSLNDYEYGAGDPVNNFDLDGRKCWSFIRGACKVAKRAYHVVRFVKNAPVTLAGYGMARLGGGKCHWAAGLMVTCASSRFGYGKSGTTWGNTFITPGPRVDARMLRHETKHADQWFLFGPTFALDYLAAERLPGDNIFERWAGLEDGCYRPRRGCQ